MKGRWLIIFFFILLRFSLGWLDSVKYRQNSEIRLSGNIDNIYLNNTECVITVGRFWINFRTACSFSQGEYIQVVGKVRGGVIDRFLGRLWLDSEEISKLSIPVKSSNSERQIFSWLTNIREKIVDVYKASLPEPEAGLVAGIVLGYKKDIGRGMYDMMIKSGTIHIAVASGYNIMLVGGTVLSVCLWLCKRKWASVVAILSMVFYAFEAGGEPPVVRAVIMAGAVFGAALVGRRVLGWWVLVVTGWLMLLVDPLILINVSFQLSMAASVGLMIVEPALNRWLSVGHEKVVEILSGSGFLTSISTMITTAPIIWWHFGRMSWIALLSNILILPFVPMLMVTGVAMQLFPVVFSWPTYAVAHWMVQVIRFFGS